MVCNGFQECHTAKRKLKGCNECVTISNDSKPTVSENQVSYSIVNKNRQTLLKYDVDGGLIGGVDQMRCDYLLMFPDCLKAFYIELKGQGWRKALEQLENTFRLVQPSITEYTPHLRAVVKQGVPNTRYNPLMKISRTVKSQYADATVEMKSRFSDMV